MSKSVQKEIEDTIKGMGIILDSFADDPLGLVPIGIGEEAERVLKNMQTKIQKIRNQERQRTLEEVFTKAELRVIRWAIMNMEEGINTVWNEEVFSRIKDKIDDLDNLSSPE